MTIEADDELKSLQDSYRRAQIELESLRFLRDASEHFQYLLQDYDALVNAVIDRAVEATGAFHSMLYLREDSGKIDVQITRKIESAQLGSYKQSVEQLVDKHHPRSAAPLITTNADLPLPNYIESIQLLQIWLVPLAVQGTLEGLLYLDKPLKKVDFIETELRIEFWEQFGTSAAAAIQHASRFRQLTQLVQALTRERDQLRDASQ